MLHLALALAPVTGMTLTAWTVQTPTGAAFVPFSTVTPLTPATPLVTFGGAL
jgi:hypothetical protein